MEAYRFWLKQLFGDCAKFVQFVQELVFKCEARTRLVTESGLRKHAGFLWKKKEEDYFRRRMRKTLGKIGIFLRHQWFLALMNNGEKSCSGVVAGWFC